MDGPRARNSSLEHIFQGSRLQAGPEVIRVYPYLISLNKKVTDAFRHLWFVADTITAVASDAFWSEFAELGFANATGANAQASTARKGRASSVWLGGIDSGSAFAATTARIPCG